MAITAFDLQWRTRIVFGPDALVRLGDLARDSRFQHALLVADPGMVAIGLADRVEALLGGAGVRVSRFHEFSSNPDTDMVERGRAFAAGRGIDSLVALGGGSSLDCAKGINFVLTNGGAMRDYHGYGKARLPMHPMIAVPTTAGTGSEAQSYALISDAGTHTKMACGDPQASFKVAILDPILTVSQPRDVTAVVGLDAISHAVESFVTTKRTTISDLFAKEAWRLLAGHYTRVLAKPDDLEARGAMLLGAHLAGVAVEQSMLGAAHACANPLTARFGATHGVAIGLMLPHVVRWNGEGLGDRYQMLLDATDTTRGPNPASGLPAAELLARRLEALRAEAALPATLAEIGVDAGDIGALATLAAAQWTGSFNPRAFDARGAAELYQAALGLRP